jgi:hypothetical protein
MENVLLQGCPPLLLGPNLERTMAGVSKMRPAKIFKMTSSDFSNRIQTYQLIHLGSLKTNSKIVDAMGLWDYKL